MVVIRTQCDMICNRRKRVCVGAGGFANQTLTVRLEGQSEKSACEGAQG